MTKLLSFSKQAAEKNFNHYGKDLYFVPILAI
jgi:hypothetical protein